MSKPDRKELFIAHKLRYREFMCPRTEIAFAHCELLKAWDNFRISVDTPLIIVPGGGFRSTEFVEYKIQSGSKTYGYGSQHLLGKAIDMNSGELDWMSDEVLVLLLLSGFRGIGRYKTWAHGDVREGPPAFWIYDRKEDGSYDRIRDERAYELFREMHSNA